MITGQQRMIGPGLVHGVSLVGKFVITYLKVFRLSQQRNCIFVALCMNSCGFFRGVEILNIWRSTMSIFGTNGPSRHIVCTIIYRYPKQILQHGKRNCMNLFSVSRPIMILQCAGVILVRFTVFNGGNGQMARVERSIRFRRQLIRLSINRHHGEILSVPGTWLR